MSVTFKQEASTFFVDENLFYAPSGSGSFVFAQFEKWDMMKALLKKAVSERTGVPLRAMRHGGLKDRAARARQWLSWPRDMQRRHISDGPNFRVLETTYHQNGLKVGHVRSNRFRLTLCGQLTENTMQRIKKDGVFPNFFGRQRFGQRGFDTNDAAKILSESGARHLDVSRFQAHLFNSFFQHRRRLIGDRLLPEDLCLEAFRKKSFLASKLSEPDHDMGEISPSGPIFGYRMVLPQHSLEQDFLAASGLGLESFRALGKRARGGRRTLYIAARDISIEVPDEDQTILSFSLPSGSYATVFLTHLFWPERLEESVETWPDFTQTVTLQT